MEITYKDNQLELNIEEIDNCIHFALKGKSIGQEPDQFVIQLLEYIIEYSRKNKYQVIFDFRILTSINSSAITPFVRVLETAQESTDHIEILYYKGLDWQDKIFSALRIFQTEDKRINIKGIKA